MKKTLALLALSLAAGASFAEGPLNYPADNFVSTKTRAEVKAELAEAVRTGNIVADGQTGALAKDLFPAQYPKEAVAAGKTRAQVKAELAEARRTGNIVVDAETGLTERALYPHRFN